MHGQRRFIETVTEAVQDVKAYVLPLVMVSHPEAPWSSAALRSLLDAREDLDPLLRDAVDLIEAFELPFVEEEERLTAAGITLADDLLGFEGEMLEFERAFWLRAHETYRADPDRWRLPDLPVTDLCDLHGLGSAQVRSILRDQAFTSFEDAAPFVGAEATCVDCRVGVTRLLSAEIVRVKRLAATSEGSPAPT